MTLHEKHMKLIDAVNNSDTIDENWTNQCILWGWQKGIEDAGLRLDLIAADLEQFERGNEHRPMCCGIFLDWEPKEVPSCP